MPMNSSKRAIVTWAIAPLGRDVIPQSVAALSVSVKSATAESKKGTTGSASPEDPGVPLVDENGALVLPSEDEPAVAPAPSSAKGPPSSFSSSKNVPARDHPSDPVSERSPTVAPPPLASYSHGSGPTTASPDDAAEFAKANALLSGGGRETGDRVASSGSGTGTEGELVRSFAELGRQPPAKDKVDLSAEKEQQVEGHAVEKRKKPHGRDGESSTAEVAAQNHEAKQEGKKTTVAGVMPEYGKKQDSQHQAAGGGTFDETGALRAAASFAEGKKADEKASRQESSKEEGKTDQTAALQQAAMQQAALQQESPLNNGKKPGCFGSAGCESTTTTREIRVEESARAHAKAIAGQEEGPPGGPSASPQDGSASAKVQAPGASSFEQTTQCKGSGCESSTTTREVVTQESARAQAKATAGQEEGGSQAGPAPASPQDGSATAKAKVQTQGASSFEQTTQCKGSGGCESTTTTREITTQESARAQAKATAGQEGGGSQAGPAPASAPEGSASARAKVQTQGASSFEQTTQCKGSGCESTTTTREVTTSEKAKATAKANSQASGAGTSFAEQECSKKNGSKCQDATTAKKEEQASATPKSKSAGTPEANSFISEKPVSADHDEGGKEGLSADELAAGAKSKSPSTEKSLSAPSSSSRSGQSGKDDGLSTDVSDQRTEEQEEQDPSRINSPQATGATSTGDSSESDSQEPVPVGHKNSKKETEDRSGDASFLQEGRESNRDPPSALEELLRTIPNEGAKKHAEGVAMAFERGDIGEEQVGQLVNLLQVLRQKKSNEAAGSSPSSSASEETNGNVDDPEVQAEPATSSALESAAPVDTKQGFHGAGRRNRNSNVLPSSIDADSDDPPSYDADVPTASPDAEGNPAGEDADTAEERGETHRPNHYRHRGDIDKGGKGAGASGSFLESRAVKSGGEVDGDSDAVVEEKPFTRERQFLAPRDGKPGLATQFFQKQAKKLRDWWNAEEAAGGDQEGGKSFLLQQQQQGEFAPQQNAQSDGPATVEDTGDNDAVIRGEQARIADIMNLVCALQPGKEDITACVPETNLPPGVEKDDNYSHPSVKRTIPRRVSPDNVEIPCCEIRTEGGAQTCVANRGKLDATVRKFSITPQLCARLHVFRNDVTADKIPAMSDEYRKLLDQARGIDAVGRGGDEGTAERDAHRHGKRGCGCPLWVCVLLPFLVLCVLAGILFWAVHAKKKQREKEEENTFHDEARAVHESMAERQLPGSSVGGGGGKSQGGGGKGGAGLSSGSNMSSDDGEGGGKSGKKSGKGSSAKRDMASSSGTGAGAKGGGKKGKKGSEDAQMYLDTVNRLANQHREMKSPEKFKSDESA